jgi:predicted Fe-Mo cluster-binding NifX family protein
MKIAITAEGDNLDAPVDHRFGRCPYFVIYDSETGEFEAIENSAAQARGGAGTQSAQLMAEKDVEVLLTGAVGPNAERGLSALGVRVVTALEGSTVRDVLNVFLKNQ